MQCADYALAVRFLNDILGVFAHREQRRIGRLQLSIPDLEKDIARP